MSYTTKKVLIITALCIVAVLIVAALLYFVPKVTPIDVTLNAVKLDEAGNELGTVQIHIKGNKLDYLFQESRLDVQIDPFFSKLGFHLPDNHNGAQICANSVEDVQIKYAVFGGWTASNPEYIAIHFTEEMDYISLIHTCFGEGEGTRETVYYVASANGKYNTQEVLDFFNNTIGGVVPKR